MRSVLRLAVVASFSLLPGSLLHWIGEAWPQTHIQASHCPSGLGGLTDSPSILVFLLETEGEEICSLEQSLGTKMLCGYFC